MVLQARAVTCFSCRHSQYRYIEVRLWCLLHQGPCVKRCPQFEREPGTDEVEK